MCFMLTTAGYSHLPEPLRGWTYACNIVRRDHGASVAARVAKAAVMPLERFGGQAPVHRAQRAPECGDSMGPLLHVDGTQPHPESSRSPSSRVTRV